MTNKYIPDKKFMQLAIKEAKVGNKIFDTNIMR
jgi:hypothetical protein